MTDYSKCKLTKKSITFNAARIFEVYNGAKCDQQVYMRVVWSTLAPKYEGKISGEVIDALKRECEDIILGKEPYLEALQEAKRAELGEKMKLIVGRTNVNIIKELLDEGADPNFLFEAIEGVGSKKIVKALIDAGADVNAKDEHGYTPLHRAVMRVQYGAVDALLSAGADVNAKDEYGRTPLDIATAMRDSSMVDDIRKFMTAA